MNLRRPSGQLGVPRQIRHPGRPNQHCGRGLSVLRNEPVTDTLFNSESAEFRFRNQNFRWIIPCTPRVPELGVFEVFLPFAVS